MRRSGKRDERRDLAITINHVLTASCEPSQEDQGDEEEWTRRRLSQAAAGRASRTSRARGGECAKLPGALGARPLPNPRREVRGWARRKAGQAPGMSYPRPSTFTACRRAQQVTPPATFYPTHARERHADNRQYGASREFGCAVSELVVVAPWHAGGEPLGVARCLAPTPDTDVRSRSSRPAGKAAMWVGPRAARRSFDSAWKSRAMHGRAHGGLGVEPIPLIDSLFGEHHKAVRWRPRAPLAAVPRPDVCRVAPLREGAAPEGTAQMVTVHRERPACVCRR